MAASGWELHQVQETDDEILVEARYRWREDDDGGLVYDRMQVSAVFDDLLKRMLPVKIVIDRVDTSLGDEAFVDDDGDAVGQIEPVIGGEESLKSLPVGRLLAQAALELYGNRAREEETPPDLPDFSELRDEWPRGDTTEVARWVGWLYMRAVQSGDPANKAVQDAMGVSRRTAQRMISLARDLGFLPEQIVSASGPSRRKG